MLAFLRVKNLALISDIELELSPGLTVLTGETGAGKSLLIQAISLLTGKRPSESLLRRGETRAVIEGIFSLDPSLKEALTNAGFPMDDDAVHVKRVIRKNGPNITQINGETATLASLRSFLKERIQISGQHEHTTLKDPEVQLWIIDAFGGLLSVRAQFGDLFRRYRNLSERLSELERRSEEEKKERELHAFQLREIDSAGLSEEEYTQLTEEKAVMNHAESLLKNLQEALDALYEQEPSAISMVQAALQHVGEMADIDPRVGETLKNLKEAEIFLEEAIGDLQHYGTRIEFDPNRLEEIEQRLSTYSTLLKKYGGSIEAVRQTQTRLKQMLKATENLQETIATLSGEREKTWKALTKIGRELSRKRRNTAKVFSDKMTISLKELGMPMATFKTAFTPEHFPSSPVESNATETGFDNISFLFSANQGELPLPIREIASGGELSRLLLTVKALITGGVGTQTIVFDEVDSGIGGRVADIVGRRIAEISRQTQVLCITHLPQIAAYGDHHLLITKNATGNRTHIGAKHLTKKERIPELARMLGGETITKTTLRHAEELYLAAQSLKVSEP